MRICQSGRESKRCRAHLRLAGRAAPAALVLAFATPAAAAPFGPATPIAGLGDQPALAEISGAAIAAGGASAIAASSDNGGARRAAVAFGPAGSPPGLAHGFGPAGAFDVALGANARGDVALTFTVGPVAYLTTCHRSVCRPTVRVGTSPVQPQSAVAVQPGNGRTTVIWRGRNRLQWRITTNGKLGPVHTLPESGANPQLATDDSGKTVAVWLAGRRGVHTAARRAGEFRAPATVTSAPSAGLRLISSDAGESVAAWLTAPDGIDPQQPLGTVQVATRTRATSFGAPQSLGTASTLSLAGSPDGHALLAVDRHVAGLSVVVAAARRLPGAAFGPFADVSPAQFVSDAFGASAAVADGGRALVTWASGRDPSASTPAGVFAAVADASGTFGAPQLLADAQTATLPQPTAGAITPSSTLAAWVGPQGGQTAEATP
jgi:hypothetical protein